MVVFPPLLFAGILAVGLVLHWLIPGRNPMCLASAGLYLAVSLLFNAVWPLVLLPLMLIALEWGVIRREERYLEAKFGAPYREYHSRVRRWL